MRTAAVLAGLLLPCLLAHAQPTAPARLHVLFLGNSLTAGNDVPAIVQELARLQGVNFTYDARAPGGVNLEDHWNAGNGQLLRTTDFDIVVLQQGPSTQPASQANLLEWTVTWAAWARSQGTEPALFMVWPFLNQPGGFALVSQSYRNAAAAAGAAVFPAGEAWEDALILRPQLNFYSDDLHANPAGSLLAAMVIGRGMFALDPNRVPTTVQSRGGTITVDAATLATFRTVVSELPAAVVQLTAGPTPPPGGPAPAPTPTAPAPKGGGGGGGAPSAWFAAALLWVLVRRRRS